MRMAAATMPAAMGARAIAATPVNRHRAMGCRLPHRIAEGNCDVAHREIGRRRGTTMAKMRVGVYPGTFDPITNGHTDIILRATRLVDKLVVGVARNAGKGPIFSTEERVAIVREEIDALN